MPSLAETIARTAAEGLDHRALRSALLGDLARAVPWHAGVFSTVDPATLLWTSCVVEGAPRDPAREVAMFELEYRGDDVNSLAALREHGPVASLHGATHGEPSLSRRYRELLQPAGVTDELRAVLLDGDDCWGSLVLYRGGSTFTSAELGCVAAHASSLATALREALLLAAVRRPGDLVDPPGVVLCDADGSGWQASADAARLLAEIPDAEPAVRSVLAAQRSGREARARIPGTDGWLALHATSVAGRPAVTVERLRAPAMADVVVRAWSLTARERDVVAEVCHGRSTTRIAARLGLSEWTVQDHLKSIFDKAGVRSRQELVASLFFDHCLPRRRKDATPSPYGWFLEDA